MNKSKTKPDYFAPGLYTIEIGRPFLSSLADVILARHANRLPDDDFGLADELILLPNRRTARALTTILLQSNQGKPMLLPQIRPLGEGDPLVFATLDPGLPPPIGEAARLQALTRMIMVAYQHDRNMGIGRAFSLAKALAAWQDEVETENLSLANLDRLEAAEFAEYWQITLDFLKILREVWPQFLIDQGLTSPALYRRQLMLAEAKRWQEHPLTTPVTIAGSTGSVSATAALMRAVLAMDYGQVILPGYDTNIAEDEARLIAKDATHAYYGMVMLIESLGYAEKPIASWPSLAMIEDKIEEKDDGKDRVRLASLATAILRPSESVAAATPLPKDEGGLTDLVIKPYFQLLEAEKPQEEADRLALILRQVLEEDGKTALLITHDRRLARRVRLRLRRWQIDIDDSAGVPLHQSPSASLLSLTLDLLGQGFRPVTLLAWLKHPFCSLGLGRQDVRKATRLLERLLIRNPELFPLAGGLEALQQRFEEWRATMPPQSAQTIHIPLMTKLLTAIEEVLAPFSTLLPSAMAISAKGGQPQAQATLASWLTAHLRAVEAIATSRISSPKGDEEIIDGADYLWGQTSGETLAHLLGQWLEAAVESGASLAMTISDYTAMLSQIIGGAVWRPPEALHPRLQILSPIEARLLSADVMILAGLNEGNWPANGGNDPWMSRAMRKDFGLSPAERNIGLQAHDFIMGWSGKTLIFSRTTQEGGRQTIPSRWWLRLKLWAATHDYPLIEEIDSLAWLKLLRQYDVKEGEKLVQAEPNSGLEARPQLKPQPLPPLAARPLRASATAIELWRHNPYGYYVRHILRLRPLAKLDDKPDGRHQGIVLHRIVQRALEAWPKPGIGNLKQHILAIGEEELAPLRKEFPEYHSFWLCRLPVMADAITSDLKAMPGTDDGSTELITEVSGKLALELPQSEIFLLTAKADRLDIAKDESVRVVDYKTGLNGYSEASLTGRGSPNAIRKPQLMIEALIASRGGYEKDSPAKAWRNLNPCEIIILPLGGHFRKNQPIRVNLLDSKYNELLDDFANWLKEFLANYRRTDQAFPPGDPKDDPYGEFEWLNRRLEWQLPNDEEGEEDSDFASENGVRQASHA